MFVVVVVVVVIIVSQHSGKCILKKKEEEEEEDVVDNDDADEEKKKRKKTTTTTKKIDACVYTSGRIKGNEKDPTNSTTPVSVNSKRHYGCHQQQIKTIRQQARSIEKS